MQTTSEAIFEAALKLPENERVALVTRLLETMSGEDSRISLNDASLIEEWDRRFVDREGSVSWSELQAEN